MINEQFINYLTDLYENIFEESVTNSKEFIIFVQDKNPHPLRIKVEELIEERTELLYQYPYGSIDNKILWEKIIAMHELDTLITNYIENNNV